MQLTRILLLLVSTVIFPSCQRVVLSSDEISEVEARAIATDYANDYLKDKSYTMIGPTQYKFDSISPSTWEYADRTDHKWHLRIDPMDGVYIRVSLNLDGTNPQMENYGYAPQ